MEVKSAVPQSIRVLDMRVDMVQIPDVLRRMEEWIVSREQGRYIIIANADSAVRSRRNNNFRKAVDCSALSVPDGMPLVWLGKMQGYKLKRRVYGPDLLQAFCELAACKGYTNYFYGGAKGVPQKLKDALVKKFPQLKVTGAYSPPFRDLTDSEDEQMIAMINKANPDVLWVGLGCPKQEIWMYQHRDRLEVPVIVGVGAAFDFHSGTKKQAPRWMREHGLEWFFRLVTEPRRLWKRYIVDGAVFLYNVSSEIILKKGGNNYTE